MSLQTITEFDASYTQDSSIQNDLISRPVFIAQTDEEIGTVENILVDESGHFRYLVVDAASWLPDRKFLLPVGRCRTNGENNSISIDDFSSKQDLDRLPPYQNDSQLDYDYEESVRSAYRQFMGADPDLMADYDRDSYSYGNEPELYQISTAENQTMELYEEKLVTHKQRREVGEVTIGKRVETETKELEIPVAKERVVVSRHEAADRETPVDPEKATFESGTVAKVKVYEETVDVEKQAFAREEVEIKKEVEKNVVNVSETLRKEELEMTGEENIRVEEQ